MSRRGFVSALRARTNKITEEVRAKVRVEILKGALEIQEEAQELVPVEFSFTKNSARTRIEVDDANSIEAYVTFGTAYAIYVHERLDVKHTNGQAKYLSTAIDRHQKRIMRKVAIAAKGASVQ